MEEANYFERLRECDLAQGWQIFSVKGQKTNLSGFVGHMMSVTTPLC